MMNTLRVIGGVLAVIAGIAITATIGALVFISSIVLKLAVLGGVVIFCVFLVIHGIITSIFPEKEKR